MDKKFLLFGLLALSLLTVSTRAATVQVSTASTVPSVVVIVMMENKSINQTYGTSCRGNCSFITQLANTYGLAESYSATGHPSLTDYLDITSGGNYDYAPFNNSCYPQTTGCAISTPSIVDSLEASGRTWKAYMEDYTGGGCTRHHNNDTLNTYVNDHNPFLYYNGIYGSPARCSRIVDANPGAEGYLALPTALFSDLSTLTSASSFMWLTPNLCDQGHSTCTFTASNSTTCPSTSLPQCVSQANQYLSLLVPKILNSTVFQTQNAALFITWDEGVTRYPKDYVVAIWAGPGIRPAHKSSLFYSHYSLLSTLETMWGMPPLTAYDASATAMNEFFSDSGPVGGIVVPTTFGRLIPFLGLGILLIVLAGAGSIYLRKVLRHLSQSRSSNVYENPAPRL